MSIKILTEIWSEPPVRQGTLLVLLALADSADETSRECWPSIRTIAKKSVLSERQVQHCLRELVEARIVDVDANAGRHGTNLYRIRQRAEWGVQKLRGGEAHFTGGVKPTSPGGVKPTSPEPSYRTVKEPSEESCNDLFSAEKATAQKPSTDDLFDQWWEIYPRKKAKKEAKLRFRAALKKIPFEQLMQATRAYAASRQGEDATYTKFPDGWLLKERWEDWLGKPALAGARVRMNPDDPFDGMPGHVAQVIRLEIDPEMRDADARAWWARQEAAE
jgi:hypothetical protein